MFDQHRHVRLHAESSNSGGAFHTCVAMKFPVLDNGYELLLTNTGKLHVRKGIRTLYMQTHPSLHKIEQFRVASPEVRVPEFNWFINLYLGQHTLL